MTPRRQSHNPSHPIPWAASTVTQNRAILEVLHSPGVNGTFGRVGAEPPRTFQCESERFVRPQKSPGLEEMGLMSDNRVFFFSFGFCRTVGDCGDIASLRQVRRLKHSRYCLGCGCVTTAPRLNHNHEDRTRQHANRRRFSALIVSDSDVRETERHTGDRSALSRVRDDIGCTVAVPRP